MEFKIADWIRHKDLGEDWLRVTNIGKQVIEMNNEITIRKSVSDLYEKWQPQKDEWVVIKPKHPSMDEVKSFRVVKYSKITCKGHQIEPFILGKFPTFVN